MNRIKNKFDEIKNSNKKALGIFITAGDPDFETSVNIIENLPENKKKMYNIQRKSKAFSKNI